MARFRLKGKHYLSVPGTEYEYKEESTGNVMGKKRSTRRVLPVPMYLDPDDPSDHNYPGEIIVSTKESRVHTNDYIFAGPPTPDMEPLDDEAEALITDLRPMWEKTHPIENLPSTFADAMLEKMSAQLEALGGRRPTDVVNVSVEEFNRLKQQNEELASRVDKLLAMLESTAKPESVRRV